MCTYIIVEWQYRMSSISQQVDHPWITSWSFLSALLDTDTSHHFHHYLYAWKPVSRDWWIALYRKGMYDCSIQSWFNVPHVRTDCGAVKHPNWLWDPASRRLTAAEHLRGRARRWGGGKSQCHTFYWVTSFILHLRWSLVEGSVINSVIIWMPMVSSVGYRFSCKTLRKPSWHEGSLEFKIWILF